MKPITSHEAHSLAESYTPNPPPEIMEKIHDQIRTAASRGLFAEHFTIEQGNLDSLNDIIITLKEEGFATRFIGDAGAIKIYW